MGRANCSSEEQPQRGGTKKKKHMREGRYNGSDDRVIYQRVKLLGGESAKNLTEKGKDRIGRKWPWEWRNTPPRCERCCPRRMVRRIR